MSPKQKVLDLAAKAGASVDTESWGIEFVVKIEAPEGRHWNVGEPIHELCIGSGLGCPATAAWSEALDRLTAATVETCGPDCEWW